MKRKEALALELETFTPDKPCRKGHWSDRHTASGKCLACRTEYYRANKERLDQYSRNWRRANPERAKASQRKASLKNGKTWRQNNPEANLLCRAKARAKKFDREFNLELADVVIPEVCPVLGIAMDKPSIDRINSNRGYTKENIQVISYRANTLKSNGTLEEFQALVRYLQAAGSLSQSGVEYEPSVRARP